MEPLRPLTPLVITRVKYRLSHHKSCPSSSSGLEFSSVLLGPAEVEDNNALLPEVAIFAGFVNRVERPDVAAVS